MIAKRELVEESGNNFSILVLVVSLFLILSIAFAVYGFLKGNKEKSNNTKREEGMTQEVVDTHEESLTEIFEKEFVEESSVTLDEYDENDPFRDICAPVSGQNSMAVPSYTVCYR